MTNCDNCGRLVETAGFEIDENTENLCLECLKWYIRHGLITINK